jgi:hypothetical protein
MYLDGDRDRTIVSLAVARSWRDADYRAELLAAPRTVLTDEGLDVPDGVEVRVLEDTATVKHLRLTRTSALEQALETGQRSVYEDCELRVVPNDDAVWYLVLPTPTGSAVPTTLSERELIQMAARETGRGILDIVVEVEAITTTTTVQTSTSVSSAGVAAEIVAVAVAVLT